jgi:hypothetical protein
LQVIEAKAGMGIEIGKGLLLARHQRNQASQDQVFEDVGVIAGVEGVTIVHGNSCKAWEFTLWRRASQRPVRRNTA